MHNISGENQNKKQKLGRGLGSLFGEKSPEIMNEKTGASVPLATEKKIAVQTNQAVAPATVNAIPPDARIWNVGIDKLIPSPYQPRQNFNKEELAELAQSIKENGILQPIVARKINNGAIEIIAGERRWRAAQIAGLHTVPVILKTLSNKETLELAIIENIQRSNLTPLEEAEAFERLIKEFSLTQQQVSERVGKDRATVANALRLLSLPIKVKNMLLDGKISAGHAKALLSLHDEKTMTELAQKIENQGWSVRELERQIKNKNNNNNTKKANELLEVSVMSNLIQNLSEDLQKALGTKVGIDYNEGKGKITINFYSNDELTQLIERIKTSCQK